MTSTPTRRLERELAGPGGLVVASMDEVGRGCLAGPVSVGVVVGHTSRRPPAGLRDSKLLSAPRREELAPAIRRWAAACAVGHAMSVEIDQIGIMAALRLAGRRAMAAVVGAGVVPDLVLLDGNYDWYSSRDLFAALEEEADPSTAHLGELRVVTRIKADLTCTGVAAASILAKVERDALMRREHLDDPRFGWDENKGYASPSHIAALAAHGPSPLHRTSWHLPGVVLGADGVPSVAGVGEPDGMMVP